MWKPVDESTPRGVEIVGFKPEWIDEDFNPDGVRACTLTDDSFVTSAKWCNYHDCYESVSFQDRNQFPTHYIEIPTTKHLQP